MADPLQGKRIAFLVANEGVEEVELTEPMKAIKEAGADVDLLAPEAGDIQAFDHLDKGGVFSAEKAVEDASAGDYDGLVLPGGVANPDNLRTEQSAVEFVRAFFAEGTPVGAICHAPWTLIEAGVVQGRTMTSWPSLETDLRNAGADWVDEEVHVDQGLVTSRKPDDIPAFNAKIVEKFAEGVHEGQEESAAARRERAPERRTMPPRGVKKGSKRDRQYEHIKASEKKAGRSSKRAEEIAARAVNKEKARSGESRSSSSSSRRGSSASSRGGRQSGKGPGGRTRDQLYDDARKLGIAGRSKMSKSELQHAVAGAS